MLKMATRNKMSKSVKRGSFPKLKINRGEIKMKTHRMSLIKKELDLLISGEKTIEVIMGESLDKGDKLIIELEK